MILELFNRIFFFKKTPKVNCWQGMTQFENERWVHSQFDKEDWGQCHSHDCLRTWFNQRVLLVC